MAQQPYGKLDAPVRKIDGDIHVVDGGAEYLVAHASAYGVEVAVPFRSLAYAAEILKYLMVGIVCHYVSIGFHRLRLHLSDMLYLPCQHK